MAALEVKVPDIGDFKDVPVIEVFVKPGDTVKAEDSLVTLESDKATMDVPAPAGGVVRDLRVKVGDKVSEGSVLLLLDAQGGAATAPAPGAASTSAQGASASAQAASGAGSRAPAQAPAPHEHPVPAPPAPDPAKAAAGGEVVQVKVPDIGDFTDVPVIEVFVKPGDLVNAEDSLVTLESDKATMDVPSPSSGRVREIAVKVGDKVSEGSVIALLETSAGAGPAQAGGAGAPAAAASAPAATPAAQAPHRPSPAEEAAAYAEPSAPSPEAAALLSVPGPNIEPEGFKAAHASPSVRKFARELGVDLSRIRGTGPKERILQEDVLRYVKESLQRPAPAAHLPRAAWADSSCCRGQAWTSRSSGRSSRSRCRASRRSPARTSPATG